MPPTQAQEPAVPAQPVVKTHKGWKWALTVLCILTLFILVPMSVFTLLGGFVFFFDAPIQSSSDEFQRWVMIWSIILSPIPSLISIILVWKKSLWWSLLGLPGFIVALWVVGTFLLGLILVQHIRAQLSTPEIISLYECPNGHAIEIYDSGMDKNGTFHPWSLYELSDSTSTLGHVHNGAVILSDQISDEVKDELATCQYIRGTAIDGGSTFFNDFKNIRYSSSTSDQFSDFF